MFNIGFYSIINRNIIVNNTSICKNIKTKNRKKIVETLKHKKILIKRLMDQMLSLITQKERRGMNLDVQRRSNDRD